MDTKSRKKESTKVLLSVIDVIIYSLVFLVFLIKFYDYVNYLLNGYILSMGLYVVFIVILGQLFEAFDFGDTRTTELVLSHYLLTFFTNVITYCVMSLVAYCRLIVKPMILLQLVDMVLATVMIYVNNKTIRHVYQKRKGLVVYGGNSYTIIDKLNGYRDAQIDVIKKISVDELDYETFENELMNIDLVVTSDVHHDNKKFIFKLCYDKGINVFDVPSITDMLLASSGIMHITDTPILDVNKFGPSDIEALIKRIIDIAGSALMLVVACPIMLVVALLIKLQDGGDVLFKQDRLTKDGKVFKIYKFRSMIMNAEKETGAVLASKEDSRITPVGKFIRSTRIDELPQLINIFKGEMSLVGPRPERPEIFEEIVKDMPEFKYRLKVKAGLTGYAQVYGRYNTTMRDKLLLDIYYIENYSLIDDIRLLLMTVKVIFIPEATEGIDEEK